MKTFKAYLIEASIDVEDVIASLKKLKYDAEHKSGKIITIKTDDNREEILKDLASKMKGTWESKGSKGVTSSAGRTVLPNGVKIEAKELGKNKLRNKGDIAEGLLGIALYTKFLYREGPNIGVVSVSDFANTLNRVRKAKSVKKGKGKTIYQETSINDLRKNQDDVNLKIMLPAPSYEDVLNPEKDALIMKLARGAINYVNSKNVTRYAKFMYVNNVKNVINILSEGTADQRGTKVDIKVIVDGRLLKNLNISLKSGTNTKQFGQVAGYTGKAHSNLWKHFKLNYTKQIGHHNNMILDHNGIKKAFHYSYKWAAGQINQRVRTNKQEHAMLKNIVNLINFFATRNEKNVKMVHFKDSGKYSVLSFDRMEDKLKGIKLEAVYRNLDFPELVIQDKKSKKKLISIKGNFQSSRVSTSAYRNLIQKEELFEELLRV